MIYNVHSGHNKDGCLACGAIGLIKESTEARKVKDEVIRQLRMLGHTVYDCTVDNAANVNANLKQIVAKCNSHKVDFDISIHFNSGAADKNGNGQTCGTEIWVYGSNSKAAQMALNVCNSIAGLGYRNRGVKSSTGLYVLQHTIAPAMLIECCFVDDADDIHLYDYRGMASAIVKGLTGVSIETSKELTSANDIVWELNHRGMVSDSQGLLEEMGKNPNGRLYWMARKFVNYLINH